MGQTDKPKIKIHPAQAKADRYTSLNRFISPCTCAHLFTCFMCNDDDDPLEVEGRL